MNKNSHLRSLFNINRIIQRLRRILLVYLGDVEAHLLVLHFLLQEHADGHGHLYFLVLLVAPSNVPGENMEYMFCILDCLELT